ncbi:MAG: hypothetical protein KF760_21410 [Candidatus Eremiobacteraeota bacterium]|nr:hypothetical protein [Candidatus Eremiobacteraeota bacterium]MCW5867562.1 hypothetical protein [Candidatus Eremiobacteraeota bacterium]
MDLRERVKLDWLDYQQLTTLLSQYSKPRDRISAFLAEGSLIRIRKGLYVFGERYRRAPIPREVLANLIYGPSYLSLDFVLSHCGLIPERVDEVTSVTTGEKRVFETPLGVFSYLPLSLHRYTPGMQWVAGGDTNHLAASPEKALIDKLWSDKRYKPGGRQDFEEYLLHDLRLDEASLRTLDRARLAHIAKAFRSRRVQLLIKYLETEIDHE